MSQSARRSPEGPLATAKHVDTRDGIKPLPSAATLLVVRCGKDITPKPIEWLWRRRLPRGRYVELVGYPGIGKTAVVMDMVAKLTTDGRWPDGMRGEPCDVVIVAAEDDAEDVLVPRLMVARANLARVHFIDGIHRANRDQLEPLDLSEAIDFAAVMQQVKTVGAGLVYIDALDDVLGAAHDGKGNAETRRALAPVRHLARETGAAVLGLRHPTKRVGLGPALNQGNGSIAYGAVARGSLLVTVDPNDSDRRLLLATKSNISRLADTLAFRLAVHQDDDDEPPRVVWEGTDPRQADEVLADLRAQEQETPKSAGADASKLEEATALLDQWLRGEGGVPTGAPVTELIQLAKQRGISEKTLRRAKEDLKVSSHRVGFGKGSYVVWALPGTIPYMATLADVAMYGPGKPNPVAEPLGPETDPASPHTRPVHTWPTVETGRWPSMVPPPGAGDAWEPSP